MKEATILILEEDDVVQKNPLVITDNDRKIWQNDIIVFCKEHEVEILKNRFGPAKIFMEKV